MVMLAIAAPFQSWWLPAISACLLAGIFFVWLYFRKIRSIEQLMDSEQCLKDLMNTAPVGIVAYRKRALVYANEACLKLLGMSSVEEMSRRNPMEFFAPHERERILGYIAARELGQPAPGNYEVSALKITGETFPMSVRISQAMWRDGQAVLMFLEDATDRHATRTALEKSETDYRGLFESAHDAILIFDPADELILDANERACEMYGLPREQLVGRSLVDFSTDAATGKQRILEVESKAVLTGYQTTHRRNDGTPIILDVNASIVEYKGHRAILSIQRDISKRRKAEDALRKSEENYRLLVENQTDLVVKTDREGRFLFVSPSYCELFGKTESELLGKAFLPLVNEDDQPASTKAMKALDVWPNAARFEQRAMTARGWRWISWSHRAVQDSEGRVSAVVGVGRDATEGKAAEEALKESEQLFRALAESSSVTIAIYQDGRLVYTNPSAEKLSGYTAEELSGMPLADLMHEDYRELLLKRAKARQQGEPVLSQYEAPLQRKDGGMRWLLINAARVTYKGKPAGIISAFDVTERRTAEERVRQSAHEIQAIFKALPDLYFRLDSGGQILDWRSGSEEDLFLRPEQITGKRVQEVLPPNAAAVIVRALREVQRGARSAVAEYSLPFPKGEQSFEARLAPLFENQVVAVVRNVTQRRRAEADLREAVRRLGDEKAKTEGILAAMGDGISIQDLDLKVLYQNEVHRRLIGDQVGQHCYQAYEGRAAVCDGCPVARACADGQVHTVERSVQTAGGTLQVEITASPVRDYTGAIVGGIESVRDITQRKRSEQKILESERRYHTLMDSANDPIFIADAETGMLLDANLKAQELIGRSLEEIRGMHQMELHPREDHGRYATMFKDHVQKGRAMGEVFVLHRDGRRIPVEISSSTIEVGGRKNNQGIFRDITERKAAEAALVESETRLRKIIELSPLSMAIVAMDGTIEFINRWAVDTFGYEPEDIPTMDRWWVQAYPDQEYRREVIATWMGLVEKAFAESREIEGREYRVTCKDGTLKTMFIFGIPVADKVFVMFQDVTEVKRAEEALRARLEQHRALIENARAIILQWDTNLAITYWNDYAAEFFGFSRQEALGASLLDTIVPGTETSGRDLEVMIRGIASDVNRFAANINENVTKEGRRVWVAWSNRPMVDAQGRLTSILSIGTDITGLKHAEEELRLRNRQLLAMAASAQAVGQFSGTLAVTQSICEAAISAFDASMAWVGLIVPESTEVTPLTSAGRDEGYTEHVRVRWDLSPRAMGPTGRAIKTRKPQVMHVDEPDFAPWRNEASKRGFKTVCALPLTHGETVRGVLTLYSEDPAAFSRETFDILDIFASQCSMVLVNAALYEEAHRTIQELWKANEALKDGQG